MNSKNESNTLYVDIAALNETKERKKSEANV
jgi:hypothetical protein